MHQKTLEGMSRAFDKLSQDQRDDIESQFENLQILWDKVIEDDIQKGHRVALELHMMEATVDCFRTMMGAIASGQLQASMDVLFDTLLHVTQFGHNIAISGWPLPVQPCEEVHSGHTHVKYAE